MLATIVSILSGLAGVAFGIIQYRAKIAADKQANKADKAREQMATELAAAREELARSRQAQERLADLESMALTDAQRAEQRERAAQRNRDNAQRLVDSRQERDRKSHERKMLGEAKKQTSVREDALKEMKRQGRKK